MPLERRAPRWGPSLLVAAAMSLGAGCPKAEGPTLTGEIVFTRRVDDVQSIWKLDARGERQLFVHQGTGNTNALKPRWSAAGIRFAAQVDGAWALWEMGAEGESPHVIDGEPDIRSRASRSPELVVERGSLFREGEVWYEFKRFDAKLRTGVSEASLLPDGTALFQVCNTPLPCGIFLANARGATKLTRGTSPDWRATPTSTP